MPVSLEFLARCVFEQYGFRVVGVDGGGMVQVYLTGPIKGAVPGRVVTANATFTRGTPCEACGHVPHRLEVSAREGG